MIYTCSLFGVPLLTLVAAKKQSCSFERDCTKSVVTVLAASRRDFFYLTNDRR